MLAKKLTAKDKALLETIHRSEGKALEIHARAILKEERRTGSNVRYTLKSLKSKATVRLFRAFGEQEKKVGAMCCSAD